MSRSSAENVMEIDGHEVRVTSPDKVFFSARGETKQDLVDYYLAVREPLLRAMGGRPILMQRFPNGASGKSFSRSGSPTVRRRGCTPPSSPRPTARRRASSSPRTWPTSSGR